MKPVLVIAALLISGTAQAQFETQNAQLTSSGWTCEARGLQQTGGPGGGYWQVVMGRGKTQLDAAQSALNRCQSMGLRQCSLGGCFRNR